MTGLIYFIIVVGIFCLLYLVIPLAAGAYVTFRGKRLVTCPETRRPAAVEVNVFPAALSAGIFGEAKLRLKSCSRWPEREGCGQECLLQVELAPEDCLIRTILDRWYRGRKCAYCGRPFGVVHWFDHKPALVTPEGVTVEWNQFSPERLSEILATHKPVCWDCHIAESFRREFPDLVTDRS
jgi:hypothetical protein